MTLTVVAALDELGISRTTIIVTFAIMLGGVVAAVAFGLGRAILRASFCCHNSILSRMGRLRIPCGISSAHTRNP